jgi:DNA-binding MarR family transcriptional regulator
LPAGGHRLHFVSSDREALSVNLATDIDAADGDRLPEYDLGEQIGFLLRQAYQRHAAIFAARFGADFTPTQWAAMSRLWEHGELSQNLLGRHTAMDVATIKGVVERLAKRGLIVTRPDEGDRRRLLISLSPAGRELYRSSVEAALDVTAETLLPLKPQERVTLHRLLKQLR